MHFFCLFRSFLQHVVFKYIADPRWRLFGHHDVIFTSYDVIIPRDVYKKIDFQTYYIPSKFLNILEVAECERNFPPPPPPSENSQKTPVPNRVKVNTKRR